MLDNSKPHWRGVIILIVLSLVITPPLISSSVAYDHNPETGYLYFRTNSGRMNFTSTKQYINVSGNMTLLPAQMWIPMDEYPADPEEIKFYRSTAYNETLERDWYWNEKFLTYAEQDLKQMLSVEYPDILLSIGTGTNIILNTSSVFNICLEGYPRSTPFLPFFTCITFNITYLSSPTDLQNLERWEATAPLLEASFRSKWYINNLSILYSALMPNLKVPPFPFLEIIVPFLEFIERLILFFYAIPFVLIYIYLFQKWRRKAVS